MVSMIRKSGVRGHEGETLGEEEIAHQHARLVVPLRVGGGVAPPHLRVIHHVVVQERRRVDVLHHASQRRGAGPLVAARLGDEHEEHRADSLAAGADEVIAHIGYQDDVRMEIRVNRFFTSFISEAIESAISENFISPPSDKKRLPNRGFDFHDHFPRYGISRATQSIEEAHGVKAMKRPFSSRRSSAMLPETRAFVQPTGELLSCKRKSGSPPAA